jgi:hemerythrin-like domain-containing protein
MSVMEKVKTYVGVYSDNDVRSLLKHEHEEIKALTKVMASDESKPTRTAAFERLKPFLTAHARAEELAVYNPLIAVKGSPDSHAMGNEGFVEHSLVDVLMERLGKTDLAGTDAWKAHAKVLKELLEHHIKEEEGEMFEELGEHFSEEQRAAMGADFEAKKLKVARRLPG